MNSINLNSEIMYFTEKYIKSLRNVRAYKQLMMILTVDLIYKNEQPR